MKEDTQIGPDGTEKGDHDSRPLRRPGIVNGTGSNGEMEDPPTFTLDVEIDAEDATGEAL